MSYEVEKFKPAIKPTHDNERAEFCAESFRQDRCASDLGNAVTELLHGKQRTVGQEIAAVLFSGSFMSEEEVAAIIDKHTAAMREDREILDYLSAPNAWPIYHDGEFIVDCGTFPTLRESVLAAINHEKGRAQ